jgi:SAM-dependent MidA family methyltransferase
LVFIAENFNPIKNEMVQKLIASTSKPVAAKENAIFEYSFAAMHFMQDVCQALQKQGGLALIIDYGYDELPLKSTLQALKNHQYHNVLQNIGECDITSLVNFDVLQNCAKKFNLGTSLTSQRNFLQNLKIEKKQESFAKNSAEYLAISRLIDVDKMGELFKCLMIWKNSNQ